MGATLLFKQKMRMTAMLNINKKAWFDITNDDIKVFLSAFAGEANNDENFFFEFKDSAVNNQKITNEVCAFANTYGGYIFIGVSDTKEISGCGNWSEERIQNLICDCVSPLPSYDARRFLVDDKNLLIIKIDEGSRQPYLTNKGEILERISSGCRKLVSEERLSTIYRRNKEQQKRIEKKLTLEPINTGRNDFPNNIVAVVDVGFEVISNDDFNLQKDFYSCNPNDIYNKFMELGISSVYRVGNCLNIAFGNVTMNSADGELDTMLQAGLNNFMVMYPEGSVKLRCILSVAKDGNVYVDNIMSSLTAYRSVYEYLFPDFEKKFFYASKYEQLQVVKSFKPRLKESVENAFEEGELAVGHIIYTGGRISSYGYWQIDKSSFESVGEEYSAKRILDVLFRTSYSIMGMM